MPQGFRQHDPTQPSEPMAQETAEQGGTDPPPSGLGQGSGKFFEINFPEHQKQKQGAHQER